MASWGTISSSPEREPVPLPGLPGSGGSIEAYQTALGSTEQHRPLFGREPAKRSVLLLYQRQLHRSDDTISGDAEDAPLPFSELACPRWATRASPRSAGTTCATMIANKTPNAQKSWLKAIRGLMKFTKANDLVASDPTQGVEPARVAKTMGRMTWGAAQITACRQRHPLGTGARLAIELLLNIAARRAAWAPNTSPATAVSCRGDRPGRCAPPASGRGLRCCPSARALEAVPASAELPYQQGTGRTGA